MLALQKKTKTRRTSMDRYIGVDAHLQTCTFAVMGQSGRRIQVQVVETNGQALKTFLLSIAGSKYICLEECEFSEWLYELFLPLAKKVVVVQPEKRKGNKNDARDAWELAETMRTGRKAMVVYKAPGTYRGLREAVDTHRALTQDLVRAKNRLRAIFRGRGIQGFGQQLYNPKLRGPWLERLDSARRKRAELQAKHVDRQMELVAEAEVWLEEEARACTAVKLLATAPGIGLIRACQTVAAVLAPHRFRTKRQFWSYCGLAVVNVTSSEWERRPNAEGFRRKHRSLTRGLNRNRNPLLKDVFKGAAMTVVQRKSQDPLAQNYRRQVEEQGVDPAMARLTLARQIAATVLAMWKHEEAYDPTRYQRTKTV
jgi:transposase